MGLNVQLWTKIAWKYFIVEQGAVETRKRKTDSTQNAEQRNGKMDAYKQKRRK